MVEGSIAMGTYHGLVDWDDISELWDMGQVDCLSLRRCIML